MSAGAQTDSLTVSNVAAGDRAACTLVVEQFRRRYRPEASAGATGTPAPLPLVVGLFQSAPRSELRGDLPPTCKAPVTPLFQSAPRSELRGDVQVKAFLTDCCCFNPRPEASSGATYDNSTVFKILKVSIRAPKRAPGRPPVTAPPS